MSDPHLGSKDRPALPFRVVGFFLLNLYAAALLIAAWPNGSDFRQLRPLHTYSRQLFERLKTRSGTEVFAGNRGAWKRKSLCITVRAQTPASDSEKLFETYPNCEVPNVRIFEDTFNVLLMRAGYPREMKPFLGASEKTTTKQLGNLQSSGSLDRVSRYFCKSPLASSTRPSHVDILWEVKQVHYGTGKVRTDLFYAHSFNCIKDRTDRRRHRRFHVVKTVEDGLELEPTVRSRERGRTP